MNVMGKRADAGVTIEVSSEDPDYKKALDWLQVNAHGDFEKAALELVRFRSEHKKAMEVATELRRQYDAANADLRYAERGLAAAEDYLLGLVAEAKKGRQR
jgi:hypothetical protein